MAKEELKEIWPEWQIEEKPLGRGSYGVVYKACRTDHGVQSYAAIKVISIPSDQAEIDSLRSEGLDIDATRSYLQNVVNDFVSEIQLMESLKGIQNIVSVEDYKVVERTQELGWDIYIRMELLTPFHTYTAGKTLSEEDVIRLGCDICTALEICAKQNVIHRDIKPENIFVNNFGHFKLGDFGIARKMENLSGGLSQKGTMNYIAPEVTQGSGYDTRVDIYSLGIVLYRLLNDNRLPFLETDEQLMNPTSRRNAVERRIRGELLPPPCRASEAMTAVISRACAFDPENRFSSATQMKEALMNAAKGIYEENDGLDKTKKVRKKKSAESGDRTISVRKALGAGENQGKREVKIFSTFVVKQKLLIAAAAVLALLLVTGGIFLLAGSGGSDDSQQVGQHLYAGEVATFKTEEKDCSYQWQRKTDEGEWIDATFSGSKTAEMRVPANLSNYGLCFRCKLTDEQGEVTYSQKEILYVLGIRLQPADQVAAEGKTAKFKVDAVGDGLSYQWQYRENEQQDWKNTNAQDNRTEILSVPVTKGQDGYQYRVQITDVAGNTLKSEPATLRIGSLRITGHPQDLHMYAGEEAQFAVEASGNGLQYQWQQLTADYQWENTQLPGSQTDTLQILATTGNYGVCLRCRITDNSGATTYSDCASLYVLGIRQQPLDCLKQEGETAQFSVEATGDRKTFQWQYRQDPESEWKDAQDAGNTTNILSVPVTAQVDDYQYRVQITDHYGNVLYSDIVTLRIGSLKLLEKPESVHLFAGETAEFTVKASGENLQYQWQQMINNQWVEANVADNQSATLKVEATTDRYGMYYRCVVTDGNGDQLTSGTAVMYVLGIKNQPQDQTGEDGSTVTFTVGATGNKKAFQWQYRENSQSQWKEASDDGNNAQSLSVIVKAEKNGYQYRVQITDYIGNVLYSEAATLRVGSLKVTGQPESQQRYFGDTVTFTVKAEGTDLKYQWQYLTIAGNWQNATAAGSNTASLTVTVTEDRNGLQYRCKIQDAYGNEAYSDLATLQAKSMKITQQPKNITVAEGKNAVFTLQVTGEGLKYQWQCKPANSDKWIVASAEGNTTQTLTVPATHSRDGYQYRCVVTDQFGKVLQSNEVTLTVK